MVESKSFYKIFWSINLCLKNMVNRIVYCLNCTLPINTPLQVF